jgi:hypothetical protein
MDKHIKIIRMITGEDIISYMEENHDEDKTVTLYDPMTVIYRRKSDGGAVLAMSPWLPVELIKDNVTTIFASDIMTVTEPKDSFAEYYENAIEKFDIKSYLEDKETNLEEKSKVDEALENLTEKDLSEILSRKATGKLH